METDYLRLNRANWDARAPLHARSRDYGVEEYLADPTLLSSVVRFDLPRLGDIGGLDVVHLQCHIGTDTLSLHRLGARVSGLDFSEASIAEARSLASRAGAGIDYVVSDVYEAPAVFGSRRFDLVYTGIGALTWLPSIARWADAVRGVLRPGGRLFVREGHPILWSSDETRDDVVALVHPYFEQRNPFVWDDASTYVEVDGPVSATVTHEWNHGIGEVVTALIERGFRITQLVEHDSVPWLALPELMTWDETIGEARLTVQPSVAPLTFTVQAVLE